MACLRDQMLVPNGADTAEQRDRIRQYTPEKYQHINQPGGYWIAAVDPQAAFEAVHGEVPVRGPERLRRAALLTDGAACAVEDYGLLGWSGLLDLVTTTGPAELLRQVRAVEQTDPNGVAHVRYKRHDDATVAACTFSEETA